MLGSGLPFPQALYPPLPNGQAVQPASNELYLPGGSCMYIPAGWWMVMPRLYSQVQFLDPVTNLYRQYGTWAPMTPAYVNSDGQNFRIFNPTGCPVGAIVTNVGSGYIQSTTTVASNTGGSTWVPIVGGAISQTVTIGAVGGVTGGANWTLPPILVASPPPAGGVPATATATVSGGAINSVTVVDQGAGYASPPTWQVIPNPFDPNIAILTIPPLTSTLTGAGTITAILCTYFGTVQTAPVTLTISGAGASATATAIMALSVTAVSFSNSGGVTYTGPNVDVDTVAGNVVVAAGAVLNPAMGPGLFIPRKANISAPVSGGVIGAAAIIDGGLFQAAPAGLVISPVGTAATGTISLATLTMGAQTDRIYMQNMGPLF